MINVDRAGRLFDMLAEAPLGLTVAEICDELSVPKRTAHTVIRVLRMTLGTSDDLFVVCDIADDGVYRYQLKSGAALVDAEQSRWTSTRVADLESRLVLFMSASKAAAAATDGRTTDGRKALLFVRWSQRLSEDLAELGGRLFP
jgi:IclR helix-turn-helix domain